MSVLKSVEYKFLQALFRASQEDLLQWTDNYLHKIYGEERVIAAEEYVYAIGDTPVMLVAHLDTVHTYPPTEMLYDREANVIWSPQGLGADDRAGVYAIMRLLSMGMRPHVLLTTDEEIGGKGAQVVASQLPTPNVNFIIQLDRRGEKDSIFYDCDNPEFEEYINKFGFETSWGTFSDISTLCPAWGIAGVNLSIGYEDEHTKCERLYVSHMQATIHKVQVILQQIDAEKDKFEYIEGRRHGRYLNFLDHYNDSNVWGKYTSGKMHSYDPNGEICYECFNGFASDFIIDMGSHGKFCGDCYAKLFTTCTKCQNAFKDRTKTHLLCETCRKDV